MQRSTPEVDRGGQFVEARQDGRAGRGEPRHRLEERVTEAQPGQREHERDGRGYRDQQPSQRHEQKTVARLELPAVPVRSPREQQPGPCGDGPGGDEHASEPVARDEGANDRQQIRAAGRSQQQTENVRYGKHCLSAGRAHEESLDRIRVAPVGEEQDQVVVGLHDGVMVRHDDILSAHDGADGSAFRKANLFDLAAYDA